MGKNMARKCIQHIVKENPFLLKDLMNSISKKVHIDKLDDINKTIHR